MTYLLKTPKFQTALLLFLIFITASTGFYFRFIPGLIFAVAIEMALLKIRKIKYFFPSAGIISILIINLLLAPSQSFLELLITILIAIVSKHILRIDKKNVFNPAAFGLFLGGLLFGHGVSWWGVSWQQLKLNNIFFLVSFIVLLMPGYISVVRVRRARIIFTFLVTYALLNFILSRSIAIFDPTVLFFSLVMLPEPMTTPNRPSVQILFGIFVAIVSILVSLPSSRLISDPLIITLLVGNIVFFKQR